MKKIKFALMLAMVVIAITACHKQTPIDEYCDAIDKAAAKIEKCSNETEIMDAGKKLKPEMEAVAKTLEENKDYKLTPEDKEHLKKSMKNMMRVVAGKMTIGNEAVSTDELAAMDPIIDISVDQATTVGDLGKLPTGL